jgi:hypothetical protein
MGQLQIIVSFLLGTNGKKFHCRDSPANNSILSFYFVLFSEQMEIPLKRRGTQTTKTKAARPGVPLIFWMPLDLPFAPILAISLARDLLFTPRYIISLVHRSCVFCVATFDTNIITLVFIGTNFSNRICMQPNEIAEHALKRGIIFSLGGRGVVCA